MIFVKIYFHATAFFLIGTTFAVWTVLGKIDDYEDTVERGNKFVDQLLTDMVHENGEDYDPYPMDNSTIGFYRQIVLNISGEASLHDGSLRGLKSLHRADNCYLKEEGGMLRVSANLGAGVLDLHYLGSVSFMTYGFTVDVFGKVPYIEVMMELTVNSENGNDGKLTKFYIEDIKGMHVWITGLGPLNWAVNTLISATSSIFKSYMYGAVENKIKSHLEDRIPNYQFPMANSA